MHRKGTYRELRAAGRIAPRQQVKGSFGAAARDPRVWALFAIYGACFGIELTVNNVLALYFIDYFDFFRSMDAIQAVQWAGAAAMLFGLMNIFALADALQQRESGFQLQFPVLSGNGTALSSIPRIRLIALGLWIALVLVWSVLYAVRPDLLEPERMVATLRASGQSALVGYIALSCLRPFTLIPSTVLIVVGTLLFPDRSWFVMISSLGGVVLSALLIYYFFEFLGIAAIFERRHAPRVRWLERQMLHKGFWLVVAWAMFPFVPTDVICYVAGTLRMPVGRFAAGVALGELPVVAFYVLATSELFGA